MRRNLLAALGFCAMAAGTADAQIISTSIPQAGAGSPEKKAAFHVMVGYASWDMAALKAMEKEDPDLDFSRPTGILIAGDATFKTTEAISLGLGGWYNSANFGADMRLGSETMELADNNGDMFSLYGNVFYKKIGLQAGWVKNSNELTFPDQFLADFNSTFDQTDFNAFVVGRFGGERWAASVGLGLYKYGNLSGTAGGEGFEEEGGGTVGSLFANGSVKVFKNLSVDAGLWVIGESDAGDDAATRLTIGVGYTF
jgi:hypothetical protein